MTKAFVTAGIHETKVKYNYGSFHFKEKKKVICKRTKIDSIIATKDWLLIKGKTFGRKCDCGFKLAFHLINDQRLEFSLTLEQRDFNRVTLTYDSSKKEHYFGFGEQATHFDMKGKKPFIWCEEQGIGRGDPPVTFFANFAGAGGNEYTSYAPIPFYISSLNRSLFIDNSTYISYNFKKDNRAGITVWDNHLTGTIRVGASPLELLEKFTEKTGRFPALPEWAYGTWLGLQGGAERVDSLVDQALAAGNPVSAVWIQDWVGRRKTKFGSQLWWRWQPDTTAYHDFPTFCQSMYQKGVRVLGYINPFLANEGDMVEQARVKGYLVKDENGADYQVKTPGFPAYMIDFTNPEAALWIKQIIKKNLIGNGLSGWMADYAEWLPLDAKLYTDVSAERYHNIYPVDWARLNREAIQEAGLEGEVLFFNRSGYSYSSRFSTLFWAGDQMVNWKQNDGLPSAITCLLSGGMSGISLNHSDIGGYTTVKKLFRITRSKRLLFRWIEVNAFTPIFRTHEGLLPGANAQVYSDPESVDFFARMGKLHYALKDYLEFYVKEAATHGYPVVRPLYLHYPDDPNTYTLRHQFLCGEELLVLPVIRKKANKVKGYFPKGQWINAWTGEIIKGSKYNTVPAPLGYPAVFIKKGGDWEDTLRDIFSRFK